MLPIRWHHDPSRFENAPKPLLDQPATTFPLFMFFASKVAMLGGSPSITVKELVQWSQRHLALDQTTLISFLGSVTPAIREFASAPEDRHR